MAVHQLLSYARRPDAVTNQALWLRPALETAHGRSTIVAHGSDDSVAGDVEPLAGTGPGSIGDGDLVVYHVTIGCAPAVDWLLARTGPFGLVHHNITPSRYFEGLSWDHARLTEQGRAELAALVPRATVIVAVSAFNAAEIAALGGNVDLVHPPATSTRRLADIADDPPLARRLRRDRRASFVHLGQRLPHKRVQDAVFAVHLLTEYRGVDATLTTIGAAPVPAYDELVTATADRLLPGRWHDTGPAPDKEVATRLRHARALVVASAHEGFCVPIVEAMAMGTPVVAVDAGAVAETAGDGALVLPADAPPTELADALHAVATDDAFAAELGDRGRRRAAEIEATIDPVRLAATFTSTLAGPDPRTDPVPGR